jgi:hypothetical protein
MPKRLFVSFGIASEPIVRHILRDRNMSSSNAQELHIDCETDGEDEIEQLGPLQSQDPAEAIDAKASAVLLLWKALE